MTERTPNLAYRQAVLSRDFNSEISVITHRSFKAIQQCIKAPFGGLGAAIDPKTTSAHLICVLFDLKIT
jgi:hypothetical protein